MSARFGRITWIVLDSVGVGEMPDAAAYGDVGSDTLGNIARKRTLHLPNLARLGLGNIKPLPNVEPAGVPAAPLGRCALASPGKDTTTGHWEMAGIHLMEPFPLYPRGFPPEVLQEFERRIGRGWLGNYAASGTEKGDARDARARPQPEHREMEPIHAAPFHEDVAPRPGERGHPDGGDAEPTSRSFRTGRPAEHDPSSLLIPSADPLLGSADA